MRSSAAIFVSYSCKRSAEREFSSKALGHPGADKITREIVALRQPMQGLTCYEFLGDLTLELGAVSPVLGHGFHPWKAQQPRSIPNPQPVHREGRTPSGGQNLHAELHPAGKAVTDDESARATTSPDRRGAATRTGFVGVFEGDAGHAPPGEGARTGSSTGTRRRFSRRAGIAR